MTISRFPSLTMTAVKAILVPSSKIPKSTIGVSPKQWEKNVTCRYCGYDGEGYSSHTVIGCRC